MIEANAIATIAYRDVMRFVRDRTRLISEMLFPIFFIAGFGAGFQGTIGAGLGINFTTFIVTGVFAQQLFQSSALGIAFLIEDRTNNFTQEIFVSPISRYTIVLGKIIGESGVAMAQGVVILLIGIPFGVSYTPLQLGGMLIAGICACLLGGAFGVLILANLGTRQAAQQIFTFVMLPQYFLAGVFVPLQGLPIYLDVISRLAPMRYAVDFTRAMYYQGSPEYSRVVADAPLLSFGIGAVLFTVFVVAGTTLFVRRERNR